MKRAHKFARGVRRGTAVAAFALAAAGVPIVIEFGEPKGSLLSRSLNATSQQADASDAKVLASPVMLSDRVALTIDSGLVSLGSGQGTDPTAPRRLTIDEARLTLDLSRPASAVAGEAAQVRSPVGDEISGFKSGVVNIRRGALVFITPSGGRHLVKDVQATVTKARGDSYRLLGKGRLKGQRVSIEGSWADLPARDGEARTALRLKIDSALATTTFDGTLAAATNSSSAVATTLPALLGNAELRVLNLKKLLAWTGLGANAGEQLERVTVSGPVSWNASRVAFAKARVDVDGSLATGALTFSQAGTRPMVDGTLAFNDLDLRRVLALGGERSGGNGKASKDGRFLSLFDADLRLSASKFVLPFVETGRGALTIALKGGRLEANLVDLEVAGGTADAQFAVDVNHTVPEASVKLKAKTIDPTSALATALVKSPLTGATHISFAGTANGVSVGEALARLAGRGEIELAGPGKLALDVAALVTAAKASPIVSWSAAGNGSTTLDKLKAKFRVINGAVTIEGLQARTGKTEFIASGRVDVPGRLMDMSLAAGIAVVPHGEPPETSHQDLLALRGTWDSPSISVVTAPEGAAKTVNLLSPAN